jgi:hypothetical protein
MPEYVNMEWAQQVYFGTGRPRQCMWCLSLELLADTVFLKLTYIQLYHWFSVQCRCQTRRQVA